MRKESRSAKSGNVIAFPGCTIPEPKRISRKPQQCVDVDQETIDILTDLLDKAQKGEINALVFISFKIEDHLMRNMRSAIKGRARDSSLRISLAGELAHMEYRLHTAEMNNW